MFWKKKEIVYKPYVKPVISEFEEARLDKDGEWIRLDFRIAKSLEWVRWLHPEQKGFTKKEIAGHLRNIAFHLERDDE